MNLTVASTESFLYGLSVSFWGVCGTSTVGAPKGGQLVRSHWNRCRLGRVGRAAGFRAPRPRPSARNISTGPSARRGVGTRRQPEHQWAWLAHQGLTSSAIVIGWGDHRTGAHPGDHAWTAAAAGNARQRGVVPSLIHLYPCCRRRSPRTHGDHPGQPRAIRLRRDGALGCTTLGCNCRHLVSQPGILAFGCQRSPPHAMPQMDPSEERRIGRKGISLVGATTVAMGGS